MTLEPDVGGPGRLFCFEGLDGSGKSTQIRRLSARLTSENIPHAVFRSPGGSPMAEELRLLLKRKDCPPNDAGAEALVHLAAILDGFEANVLPALREGRVVLLDRFVFSTAAYQGAGDPTLFDKITELSRRWFDLSVLTRVFLIDVEPTLAVHRMALRVGDADRYDRLPVEAKQAVRMRYLSIAQSDGTLFKVVSGDRTPAVIEEEIWQDVARLMERVP